MNCKSAFVIIWNLIRTYLKISQEILIYLVGCCVTLSL